MSNIYTDSVLGNDTTGTGAIGAPYKTLDKSLTVATTNDTILLVPQSTDYVMTPKTIPAGLTIKTTTSLVPDVINSVYARINAGGAGPRWTLLGNITCENIYFYNWSSSSADSFIWWNTAAGLSGIAQVIQFTNCIIDTMATSIGTGGRGGVIGNAASLTTPPQLSITINFDRSLIKNIKKYSSTESAFIHTYGNLYTIRFRECTIYNPSGGNELNTFVANYSSGGSIPYFRNCIITSDETSPFTFCKGYWGLTEASTVEYCNYYRIDTTGAAITNSINSDPLFLDKANNDFRLKPDSPAINLGQLV